MARSIRSRVIQELPLADDVLTSTQLAVRTGIKLSSLSSVLCRMAKDGDLVRVPDFGPRGGYGYRRKTVEEAILESIRARGLRELIEKQDREFFELVK